MSFIMEKRLMELIKKARTKMLQFYLQLLETEEELVELLKQHGMLDKESAFKYNIQNV